MTCFLSVKILILLVRCMIMMIQVLLEIAYQLLRSCSEQIKDWGWICNIHAQNSESFRRYTSLYFLQNFHIYLNQVAQNIFFFNVWIYFCELNFLSVTYALHVPYYWHMPCMFLRFASFGSFQDLVCRYIYKAIIVLCLLHSCGCNLVYWEIGERCSFMWFLIKFSWF